MTTLQEAARKSFEVWKKTGSCFYLSRNNAPGSDLDGYQDAYTQGQWIAWQAALVQQVEPTDDQLVKGVKAMRLFVTKNSVADFKLGYMAALAAAPAPQAQDGTFINEGTKSAPKPGFHDCTFDAAPQAQPVAPLTDDEILTIAHRKATRYTHAVAPGQVTYGFSVAHLLDFANSIREVK